MRKNLWWATVPVALALAGCSAAPPSSPSPSPNPSTSPGSSLSPASVRTPPAPPQTAAPTTTAPPSAADGEDYAACKDGRCEVKVAKSARIPVFELTFAATFAGGVVKLSTAFPGGGGGTFSLGVSDPATVGRPDGSWITVTFTGLEAGAAVLDVTTK